MTLKSMGALMVLLTILLGATGLATATDAGSYDKALAEAKAANQMLVIDFYTDW